MQRETSISFGPLASSEEQFPCRALGESAGLICDGHCFQIRQRLARPHWPCGLPCYHFDSIVNA